jgi:signal transduction histidine kinase
MVAGDRPHAPLSELRMTNRRSRSRVTALRWTVGGTLVLAMACWANAPYSAEYPVTAAQDILIVLGFAASGAALYSDGRQRGNAGLFWLTAALYLAGGVGGHEAGPWPVIEYLARAVTFVPLAAVLLRYPEARIQRRYERLYLIVAGSTLFLLRLVEMTLAEPAQFGHSASTWWPTVWPSSEALMPVDEAAAIADAVFSILLVPLVVARMRRTAAIDRRMLQPVMVAAAAVGIVSGIDALLLFDPDIEPVFVVTVIQGVALLLVPAALLVAALRRRLSQAAVGDLVRALARPVTIDRIRSALRTSLADPRVEIAYWLPEAAAYFDTDGRPYDPAVVRTERTAVQVTASDGGPLALVDVDRSMRRHPELLDATMGAAALALENGRLQADVRAQLVEVHESRARLVDAADTARRRIERDLHDGAQQRLVALKLALGIARRSARSPIEITLIDRTRHELQAAIDELRALARGIHPAVLTEAGLEAAITGLVERLPLDVEVDVPPDRWPPPIEATAYFVTCESLANTVKHSGARHALVTVATEPGTIVLQVADDGAGGAELKPGGGLHGLQDRVMAIGGTLSVISPEGRGTEVVAWLPRA